MSWTSGVENWATAALAHASPGTGTSHVAFTSGEVLVAKCLDASKPLFVHLEKGTIVLLTSLSHEE